MSNRSRRRDLKTNGLPHGDPGDPFTAAFASTRMPMAIADPRRPGNPIVLVNPAFESLTGYSGAEAVGRDPLFLQGPDTNGADLGRLREALAAGTEAEAEVLSYRKDGSSFWDALSLSPVREGEQIVYVVASHADVTARRAGERELRQANETLEAEVARRTRDLQAALEQKTVLLHEVDHRVKNNLQVVSSLILLKARRIRDPATQRALHNITERISALSTVHRLLYSVGDVSRFDLAAFIRDLCDDLMATVGSGRVGLDLDLAPILVPAAKATSLALVINELATNVLRHAFPEERPGRMRIAAARIPTGVELVVQDDGIGLGPTPPVESFGHTLVDLLVRQLRGTIAYQDTAPGTRVVLTVPLDARELAEAGPLAAEPAHG